METLQAIKERRSIRKFTDELVSEELMRDVVSAAAYAPSWKNTQITRYHLIQNEALITKVAEEGTMGFAWNAENIKKAKNLVVVSYVKGRCGFERDGSYTTSKGEQWQMFDAGIATQTFCLAAHELGLGSVILGIFEDDKVAEIIGLPEDEVVAALVMLGRPAEEPAAPARKSVEELLTIIK